MGFYGFKKQFWPYVLDGSKRHTIRLPRKYPDTPGRTMYLNGNPRRPDCFLLMASICEAVKPVVLDRSYVELDGTRLTRDERDGFAWTDGFRPDGSTATNPGNAFELMSEFWRGSMLPLEASASYWRYPPEWFGHRSKLREAFPVGYLRHHVLSEPIVQFLTRPYEGCGERCVFCGGSSNLGAGYIHKRYCILNRGVEVNER